MPEAFDKGLRATTLRYPYEGARVTDNSFEFSQYWRFAGAEPLRPRRGR